MRARGQIVEVEIPFPDPGRELGTKRRDEHGLVEEIVVVLVRQAIAESLDRGGSDMNGRGMFVEEP